MGAPIYISRIFLGYFIDIKEIQNRYKYPFKKAKPYPRRARSLGNKSITCYTLRKSIKKSTLLAHYLHTAWSALHIICSVVYTICGNDGFSMCQNINISG